MHGPNHPKFPVKPINTCSKWEGWAPVNRFYHISGMAVVTPTDRPKSVRNRCVTKGFSGVFGCHVAFWIFVWM